LIWNTGSALCMPSAYRRVNDLWDESDSKAAAKTMPQLINRRLTIHDSRWSLSMLSLSVHTVIHHFRRRHITAATLYNWRSSASSPICLQDATGPPGRLQSSLEPVPGRRGQEAGFGCAVGNGHLQTPSPHLVTPTVPHTHWAVDSSISIACACQSAETAQGRSDSWHWQPRLPLATGPSFTALCEKWTVCFWQNDTL